YLQNGDHPGQLLVSNILAGSNYNTWSRAMWIDLHDRFHESNAPRVYQNEKLLSGLQQGSMEISSYYTCNGSKSIGSQF
ncbi:hypothetical protein F511_17438, partial [Dorcoceras hygrometricum]